MKFSEYLTIQELVKVNCPAGIFAKVTPTTESITKLVSFFSGFPLIDDLHCTLMYTSNPSKNNSLPVIDKNSRYPALGCELAHWDGQEKLGYIVLKLKSAEIEGLEKLFRNAGFTPNFENYTPHVSLVHPVPNFGYLRAHFDHYNYLLQKDPLQLDFYYDGYVIQDESV